MEVMLAVRVRVRLVAEIQERTERLIQKQGGLLEDVLVLWGQVEEARCRWRESIRQTTLV